MGDAIYFNFRARKAPRVRDEPAVQVRNAIAERNVTLLDTFDPDTHPGIKHYKRTSNEYRLLKAVYYNDVQQAKLILQEGMSHCDPNALAYWHFPNEKQAHLLTAAHLTPSLAMADLLLSYKVNFNQPDHAGIMPLQTIEKFTRDFRLLSFLEKRTSMRLVAPAPKM